MRRAILVTFLAIVVLAVWTFFAKNDFLFDPGWWVDRIWDFIFGWAEDELDGLIYRY